MRISDWSSDVCSSDLPVDMDELFNQFFALLLVAATTIIAPTSAASLATASAPVSTTPTAAPAFLLGSFAFDASDGFSFNLVFFSHVQNSNPPSRAASASAFTRPWKRKPPRSNTTLVTPALVAAAATRLPTCAAAADRKSTRLNSSH